MGRGVASRRFRHGNPRQRSVAPFPLRLPRGHIRTAPPCTPGAGVLYLT